MGKGMWPIVITFADREIGKVCSHRASKALLGTGVEILVDHIWDYVDIMWYQHILLPSHANISLVKDKFCLLRWTSRDLMTKHFVLFVLNFLLPVGLVIFFFLRYVKNCKEVYYSATFWFVGAVLNLCFHTILTSG